MSEHIATKACTRCGQIKPLSEYHRNPKAKGGHDHKCRHCDNARKRARYAANPVLRAHRAAYYAQHRNADDWRANGAKRMREYRASRPEQYFRSRALYAVKYHGIANAEEMIASIGRNEVCTVCREICKTGKRLAMDHDHGPPYGDRRFRGWLCGRCNRTLGQFEDNPFLLVDLALYAALQSRPHSLGPDSAERVREIHELRDDLHDAFNRLHEHRAERARIHLDGHATTSKGGAVESKHERGTKGERK